MIVKQLEPLWEPHFIHSSFACRKVRIVSQGGAKKVYALQLDVASFFATIHRPTLNTLLIERHPRGFESIGNLQRLIEVTYLHDPRTNYWLRSPKEFLGMIPPGKSWCEKDRDQGLPIGNLTSQFSSNVYLSALDHFIQRELKPAAYLRYMD